MRLYLVGGAVRDEIMGVKPHDLDYTVVLEDEDFAFSAADPFKVMVLRLREMGYKIFLETPQYFTVRAQFPINGPNFWKTLPHSGNRLTADFVLARKESGYADGRRPDAVVPGTLEDDIFRRDLTINALAKDADGNIIDLVGGVNDIKRGIIRAVGDPFERLTEDALRAVRALRFSVTKGFSIDPQLAFAMESAAVLDAIINKISDERINDELAKMFAFDTVKSVFALNAYPALTTAMFRGRVRLMTTMKAK